MATLLKRVVKREDSYKMIEKRELWSLCAKNLRKSNFLVSVYKAALNGVFLNAKLVCVHPYDL